MPFSLLLLAGDGRAAVPFAGEAAAALAFVLVGYGMHMTQTAGLALATDLAPEETRPRVVALLYVTLLLGTGVSAVVFGYLLEDFDQMKLIQVIQGAAGATMAINLFAMYKQEPRDPSRTRFDIEHPTFRQSWNQFAAGGRASRLLVAVGLGTAGFSMQDILLEPYGGQILHLSVSETTHLTALLAFGGLVGFTWAARALGRGADSYKLAGFGALAGIGAFSAVVFAAPLGSAMLFRVGTILIGFGGGLFSVCTLTAAMELAKKRGQRRRVGRLGRRASDFDGSGHRLRRRHSRRRHQSRNAGRFRPCAHRARRRLQRRLPPGDRAAVRDANRGWATRSYRRDAKRAPVKIWFGRASRVTGELRSIAWKALARSRNTSM